MKKYRVLILIMLVLSMSGAGWADSINVNNTQNLEPLYGVSFSNEGIEFDVKSSGCTTAEHFKLNIYTVDDLRYLRIERIKADRCRRMPNIVNIVKSVDFSDIDSNLAIMIDNPFKLINK